MCKGKDVFLCSCQGYLQTLAATNKTKDNTPTAYFIHVKSFLDVQEAINQITFSLCFRLLCSTLLNRLDGFFSYTSVPTISSNTATPLEQHCLSF